MSIVLAADADVARFGRSAASATPDILFRDTFLLGKGSWSTAAWSDSGGIGGAPYITCPTEGGDTRTWDSSVMTLHQAYRFTCQVKGEGGFSYGPPMTSEDWAVKSWVVRMPIKASLAQSWFAVLAYPTGAGLDFASFQMEAISEAEYAAFSDEIMANLIGANVRVSTATDQLALLPSTMAKLQNGPLLNVLCFGDSWQGTQSHAAFAELLSRAYPNCHVAPYLTNAGSHGMQTWAPKMAEAVTTIEAWTDVTPDLIYCGGVSDNGDADSWNTVLTALRAAYPNAEYIAGGIANGLSGATSDAIEAIAAAQGIAYYPAGDVMNNLLSDAGVSLGSLLTDGVHLSTLTGQILAQGFAAFLGATPTAVA